VNSQQEWADIVRRVASAESHEEEADIGRGPLASLLFHASPQVLDQVLKMARRDNRMRRCLSAARYYSGLKKETCDKIDAVLQTPFPGAKQRRRWHGPRPASAGGRIAATKSAPPFAWRGRVRGDCGGRGETVGTDQMAST